MFLYFLSKLVCDYGVLSSRELGVLEDATAKGLRESEKPVEIALHITAARLLSLSKSPWTARQATLAAMQQSDGSWPMESLWHFGSQSGYFGSESLSTAFAIEALLS
jgi:hypothetical protein